MLNKGIIGHEETIVSTDNVAVNVGSGNLKVFATPSMIALMEKAAALSVEPHLEEGQTTVGSKVDVIHSAPSLIGAKIIVESELVDIDRRKLTFKVKASDEAGVIGEGTHERFVIDIRKFLEKAEGRK